MSSFFLSLILFILLLLPTQSFGNKLILFTDDDPYGKVNQEKNWYIAYGEPAFANFYDLKVPEKFFIITPEGEKEKLTLLRKELFDPWFNQPRISYETKILPKTSGDYSLCIESEPLLSTKGLIKYYGKAFFHVEREFNWDKLCGFDLEIKPFTRPYGLRPGALFWGQVILNESPLQEGSIVVERLRKKLNLKALPTASTKEINVPIYQKTTKLDKNGYFFVNFEEPGWWVISVETDQGKRYYGNQLYPYYLSTHLWIYVFEAPIFESKKAVKTPAKSKPRSKKVIKNTKSNQVKR